MTTCGSLFSGIGLLDYGLHLAGWEHRWFCEADGWRRGILARRWPGRPVFDDVRKLTAAIAEPVTLVAGGFPCKGASTAGKRTGFGHPETVLWREQARVIRELRPRYALVENVANLRGIQGGECFSEVLGDLAACGYDCWWDCIPAAAFGAAHRRDRVFIVAAHPDCDGVREQPRRLGGQGRPRASLASGDGPPTTEDADGGTLEPGRLGRRAGEATEASAAADAPRLGRSAGGGLRHFEQAELWGRRPAREAEPPFPWGEYEPAIRLWESVVGRPCPRPLIRRVAARSTRRVERSRLSALGDGVQVQAGYFMGRLLMERARA